MLHKDLFPAPDVTESEDVQEHRTLTLVALARTKLNSFRDKDRMPVRDMIDVGLLDQSWCSRFDSKLAARLQALFENPNG